MKKAIIITGIIVLILLGVVIGIYSYAINAGVTPLLDDDQTPGINNACLEIGCDANSIYAGSINSDKYYECRCRWAKTVNPENLICFYNDEVAVADGRTKSEC